MEKVVLRTSFGVVIIYVIIGFFGYLTFADRVHEQLLSPKTNGNILECDYKGSKLISFVSKRVKIPLGTISSDGSFNCCYAHGLCPHKRCL